MDLPKTFDSKAAEERWFQLWIDLDYFKADPARPGKVFSVVIPPPNVTGQLHLGHALNVSLQDIIVRTRRMQGYNTLWLPGTDHAGIAVQNAVEKDLAKEGKDRHQLGRDAFVDRVWEWRETYGHRILNQLRRLGASCDWSRERFTLDAGLSQAVTKVFVDLYNKRLIYRAMRLINWCPRCETALSDLEVDHKDVQGSLWYIRYPLADGSGAITIATTRPETMLGDTAVAVNPDDERYKSYVGKTVRLPLIGREIKIIADAAIDREFGTGAVKVTPAHDPVDFELGKRHGLEQISIFDGTAHINENGGPYRGMSREDARKEIVKHLEIAGLLEKIEPHKHAVGVCSRCDTVVEPMLSEQWFLRDARDGRSRDRGGPQGRHDLPSEVLGEHVLQLAREHPRLVHLAPAMVGPSDSRLPMRAMQSSDRRRRAPIAMPRMRRFRHRAGRRRARHLVQLGPVADVDARMAGGNRRTSRATIRPACCSRAST